MATNSISTNEILVVVGIGAYLWYAHKQGWFPFGNNGPFGNNNNNDNQQQAGGNIMSIPPPNNTQPFSQSNQIDLGSGFHMPVPPGNGYIDGQTGREIFATGPNSPFTSTVANDPSATDYGIYTQYLNGLRNEYQSQMQQQQAVAGQQQEGIGGDITTLPQPPTVGIIPYGFGGPVTPGMNPMPPPPGFIPSGPPPRPYLYPPVPIPMYYRRRRHRRRYDNDNNNGGINVGPIHVGTDGIRIGDMLGIGAGGINLGGLFGGLFGGSSDGNDNNGGINISTGGGINIGSSGGFSDLSGQPINGIDVSNMLGNIGFDKFQQFTGNQNNLQQQIQDRVNQDLARYGIIQRNNNSSSYARSYVTFPDGTTNDNNTTDNTPSNSDQIQFQLPTGLDPNDPQFPQKLQAYIDALKDYLAKNLPINSDLNPINTPFDENHPLHPLNPTSIKHQRNHRGGKRLSKKTHRHHNRQNV